MDFVRVIKCGADGTEELKDLKDLKVLKELKALIEPIEASFPISATAADHAYMAREFEKVIAGRIERTARPDKTPDIAKKQATATIASALRKRLITRASKPPAAKAA